MENRGGRREHKTVGGRKGKTIASAICARTSGSKGFLIKMIIRARRQGRKPDYETPRREKSPWARTDGLRCSPVTECRDVVNMQKTAGKAFQYTKTFQIQDTISETRHSFFSSSVFKGNIHLYIPVLYMTLSQYLFIRSCMGSRQISLPFNKRQSADVICPAEMEAIFTVHCM